MNILQNTICVVLRYCSKEIPCLFAPRVGQLLHRELFPNEHTLQLESQDDVETVGHLVRLNADVAWLHHVDRTIELLNVHAGELLREMLFDNRVEVVPERTTSPDNVFPEPRHALMDAQRRRLVQSGSTVLRRKTELVESVAGFVNDAEERRHDTILVVSSRDPDIVRSERSGERVD